MLFRMAYVFSTPNIRQELSFSSLFKLYCKQPLLGYELFKRLQHIITTLHTHSRTLAHTIKHPSQIPQIVTCNFYPHINTQSANSLAILTRVCFNTFKFCLNDSNNYLCFHLHTLIVDKYV